MGFWCLILMGALSIDVSRAENADIPAAADEAQLRAEYDRMFQEMLKQPANLDLMFEFAAVATRLGNYEAAISTLERMLLFNRDLPRVKLELGALYFRIGSYPIARSYLEDAISGPNVPTAVKQRVQAYLDQIDKRTARSHLTGSVTTGLRYQTNVNAGPSSAQVLAGGINATLDNNFLGTADWNAFVSTYFAH